MEKNKTKEITMSAISTHIEAYENLGFSFENMHKRTSLIGILPIQANASSEKDENGVERFWCHLVANYKSTYTRQDEHGELHDDNASLKTLLIKFPMDMLQKNQITSSQFKNFFDKEYCGKKFLFLPVSEEKQKFDTVGKNRVPVKNVTECTIDPSFNLAEFFQKSVDEVFKPSGAKKS
jgi:hypothetical protein